MARYPFFNYYLNNLSNEDVTKLYSEVKEWGSILIRELDKRDLDLDTKPSNTILTVTTVTQLSKPKKGDIAYSVSTGKFKGYVSLGAETSWQNLN
jgi:hypothetical protein|tara:strand:+ start:2031 stop:2315 length:285 start_codon:yes stop_codon:yes gene_type:complete